MNSLSRLLVAIYATFTVFAHAQTPADAEQAATLRALKSTYETALNTGELSPLQALFGPETSAILLLGEEVKTYEQLAAHWQQVRTLIGPGGSYMTTLHPEPSLFYGDLAVSRGTAEERVRTDGGQNLAFTSLWTAVLRREGGNWKVIRLHASMNPVDNVFTALIRRRTALIYGLGGGVAGLLIGAAGVWLLKRRSANA